MRIIKNILDVRFAGGYWHLTTKMSPAQAFRIEKAHIGVLWETVTNPWGTPTITDPAIYYDQTRHPFRLKSLLQAPRPL